jgi:hypothetical protein
MDSIHRKILTIVTEALLETSITEALNALGVSGYTIVNARGRGSRVYIRPGNTCLQRLDPLLGRFRFQSHQVIRFTDAPSKTGTCSRLPVAMNIVVVVAVQRIEKSK